MSLGRHVQKSSFPETLNDIHSCVGSWPEHFRFMCDLVYMDRPSSTAMVPLKTARAQDTVIHTFERKTCPWVWQSLLCLFRPRNRKIRLLWEMTSGTCSYSVHMLGSSVDTRSCASPRKLLEFTRFLREGGPRIPKSFLSGCSHLDIWTFFNELISGSHSSRCSFVSPRRQLEDFHTFSTWRCSRCFMVFSYGWVGSFPGRQLSGPSKNPALRCQSPQPPDSVRLCTQMDRHLYVQASSEPSPPTPPTPPTPTPPPKHQNTKTPTHQHTNTPTHQHTNTPTHQRTNAPPHQRTNPPTH